MTANVTIRIQEADFDIAGEISALTKGRSDIGAVVSFSGICRGTEGGETIAALTLEHYPEMAEAEIARHAEFQAAEFLMDYLKANAPFWKREESADGASWVAARHHDDAAAARWTKS